MFSLLLFVSLSLPYFVSTKYRSISSLPFPPFLFSVTVLLPLMLLQFATLSLAKLHYSEHFSSRPRADHLLHALQQQGGGAFHGAGAAQTHRCFSCMSPMYAELFKDSDLGKHFYEPKNFSAKCDDPMEPTGIGTVPCRGICLTLSQEFIIMGRKTGKRLTMRGCASTLSRHGYHNRTIAFFAEFDLCREVLASELFRLTSESSSEEIYYGGGGFMAMGGPMNPMDGQPVQVCSCLGDKCNKQMSSGSAVVVRRHFFFVGMAPVLYALLLICFHNYFSFSPNFRIIFK